ncbi:hypothetical protein CR513_55406, partial [Mucuna pruriens]
MLSLSKSNDNGEKSNFSQAQEEEISLLMVCHTKEEANKHFNHMCGDKTTFNTLDESYIDDVNFNNAKVVVMRKGYVSIQTTRTNI